MSAAAPARPRRGDLVALALLAVAALALAAATPALVVPYRPELPWWESGAAFPRASLLVLAVGAAAEAVRRLRGGSAVPSEEIDSSGARLGTAAAVVMLFVGYALAVPWVGFGAATAVFLLVAGRVVGLAWRHAAALALPLAAVLWLVFVLGLKVSFGRGWLV